MEVLKLLKLFWKKYVGTDKKSDESAIDNLLYLNNADTLPALLSKDEEEECFNAIVCGDTSARNKLIVHNLRLVVYIAKKFESSGVALDDLISIGTIGLIKAVKTFCPDKNIKLATYASRCIENEVLMFLRKISHSKAEISFDEPLNVDWDGNELLLGDILSDEGNDVNEAFEHDELISVLMDSVEKLPEREKQIIYLRYGLKADKDYTQKEVADILGISQSYISRIEKKVLEQLKFELIEKNVV